MKIKDLVWPRQDDIVKLAETENLDSDKLLALQSVSFYLPIAALEGCKGEKESNKKEEVRAMYNVLRWLDNCEDSSLKNEKSENEKSEVMGKMRYIMSETVRKGSKEGIEELISGDLRSVTKKMIEGARDEKEKVFAEHFGRGAVLYDIIKLNPEVQKAIYHGVEQMATGMSNFLGRGHIQEKTELQSYCYYVAGSIGDFLNRLVYIKDNVTLDDKLAESFGERLQLINIMKGIAKDNKEDRVFLPAEFHKGISHKYLMSEKIGIDAQEARKNSLQQLIKMADANFQDSIEYNKSIPRELSGYRAFCLMPFLLANETLDLMKRAGAEAVFAGDPDALKISYGLNTIGQFACSISQRGELMDEFLNLYGKNPQEFSFAPEDYRGWGLRMLESK